MRTVQRYVPARHSGGKGRAYRIERRDQTARGGIPAVETTWTPLDIDTESPIIHAVPDTVATTYAYRARYVGKNLKFGPFGDPVVCTVSV